MIERTEELGLAARLPIVVGGSVVNLRTLNLDESELWEATLAAKVADFDLPDKGDPAAVLTAFANQPSHVMLALVQAYDVDGRLPSDLPKRFTRAELYAAVKQMVLAENPFITDLHSMAEAFGPQLRAMAASVLFSLYQPAKLPSGPSLTGEPTPKPSAKGSRKNGSSSVGPTASGA